MIARWPVALVLENGKVFRGEGFGSRAESIGEVDHRVSGDHQRPSYAGQRS